MTTFDVQYSPRGILAQPPPDLVNMALFSALVTPVCAGHGRVAHVYAARRTNDGTAV